MEPTIHQAERREQRGRRAMALAALTAIALIGGAWLGLFAFLGANSAHGTITDLQNRFIPDPATFQLDLPAISRLSEVYTADGVLLGKLTERNSQPVPIEAVPETVVDAILAAEDEDYFEHAGIDFRAIVRAAMSDLRGGNRQGGSTITQQVVKTNFVGSDVTLERKIREAVVAAELERRYTKEEVLEFYLNSVYFGWNAYGIRAAAEEYFGKDLGELTIAEAAALATPIRNPSLYDLRNNPDIVLRSRNAVIDNMIEEGMITAFEGGVAKQEALVTTPHTEFKQLAPQVLIAAKDEVLTDPIYGLGDSYLARTRALFGCPAADTSCEGGGGLKIFVTLDYELQQDAVGILQDWFPNTGEVAPTGAIAMVDNETGAIRVMAGGLEFGDDLEAGQRNYDLAGKGRQNAGSAFKPFGLVAALETGYSLNSFWDWTNPQILDYPGAPEPWECNNFGNSGEGIRTLESALYNSTNTVFCQVAVAVGADKIADAAHRMGIKSPLEPVPSIVLGTQEVSPLEMAAAYSTFANMGVRTDAYLIERIEDEAGNVVYEHEVTSERVLDEAVAAAAVNTMEQVITRGTGTRADIGRPQAGKTGTHTNFTDVWFVGYIPQFTTAVWVGHADQQIPMRNIEIKGEFYTAASSSRIPAPIWREFMEIVTAGLPVEDFPPDPPGTNAYYVVPRTRVPDIATLAADGELGSLSVGSETKALKEAFYKSGLTVTIEWVNSVEAEGAIIEVQPEVGTLVNQGGEVAVQISNGIPPAAPLVSLIGLQLSAVNDTINTWSLDTGVVITWSVQTRGVADPMLYGRVVATSPPPGELVMSGDSIVVFVAIPVFGDG
ncbi:MAG: transglycosylase domain-containing protein [Acidimicrobiia bacterium]